MSGKVKYSLVDLRLDLNATTKEQKKVNTAYVAKTTEVGAVNTTGSQGKKRAERMKQDLETLQAELPTVQNDIKRRKGHCDSVLGKDAWFNSEKDWFEEEIYRLGCYFTEGPQPTVPGANFTIFETPMVNGVKVPINELLCVDGVHIAVTRINGHGTVIISHNTGRRWEVIPNSDIGAKQGSNFIATVDGNNIFLGARFGNTLAVYKTTVVSVGTKLVWERLGGDDINFDNSTQAIFVDNNGNPVIGGYANKYFVRLTSGHWIARGGALDATGRHGLSNGIVKYDDTVLALPDKNHNDTDGAFILRSTDNGVTWDMDTDVTGLPTYYDDHLKYFQGDYNGVLYAYHRRNGIMYSRNRGKSWHRCQSVPSWFHDGYGPTLPFLYAKETFLVTINGLKEYCYSVDGGFTWRTLDVGKTAGIPPVPDPVQGQPNRTRLRRLEKVFVTDKKIFAFLEGGYVTVADVPAGDMGQSKRTVVITSADNSKRAILSLDDDQNLTIGVGEHKTILMGKDTGEFIAAGDVKGEVTLKMGASGRNIIN